MQLVGRNNDIADINSEGQALSYAICETEARHTSKEHGEAYSMTFSQAQADAAVDEALLYIKNESDTQMIIEGVDLSLSTSDDIVYCGVGGSVTTAGTTENTPVNKNQASGKDASGDFYTDDGATFAETGFTTILRFHVKADAKSEYFKFPGGIILAKNDTFIMAVSTDQANTATGQIHLHYHD